MNAWASVDKWKSDRRRESEEALAIAANVKQQSADIQRAERFHWKRWENLKTKFRELPAELAEACYRSARQYTRDLKGLSPMSPAAEVAMDWLETRHLGPGARALWRPMCTADRAMVVALGTVRMPPSSGAKRIRGHLLGQLTKGMPLITEPQAFRLRELVYTFRRQIRPEQLPDYARWLLAERKDKR